MINFIICDDNQEFANKVKNIIKNFMMNFDIEEGFYLFSDYGSEFKEAIVKIGGFKIFMLDIETPNGSGLDASRYIREEIDDWNSVIILVTAHNELKYEALGNRLFIFDFVNKFDDYEQKLKEDLEKVKKKYDNRESCLTFESNRVIKKIDFRNIIMIEKEKDSKRCIIKATYGDYVISKNLNSVFKMLDKRFIKASRSLIVNIDHIIEYDYSNNKITFKNGTTTNEISRAYKKKVIDNVKCYNR